MLSAIEAPPPEPHGDLLHLRHPFGDPRGLRIDRRPYRSVAEHDAALVRRWNETVAAGDVVWHLGDFASARRPERIADLLGALNEIKHLIIGNNDGEATIGAPAWASVQHYAEMTLDGTALVLCHYPFRTWNRMGRGAVNLHGHSHGRLKAMPRQHDVGVDAWDYRPVTLATILAGPRSRDPRNGTHRRLRPFLRFLPRFPGHHATFQRTRSGAEPLRRDHRRRRAGGP